MIRINTRSIASKILLIMLIVTILEAFLLISVSYFMSQNTMSKLIDNNSKNDMINYSTLVGNWIHERLKETEIYAQSPVIRTMDWGLIDQYLKNELLNKSDIYDLFLVADTNGNYNTTLNSIESNISDRPYFQAAIGGASVVSDPIISRVTGGVTSIIAVPIVNDQGNITGIIGASINLNNLSGYLLNFNKYHADSFSYLVNKDGIIISHPHKDKIMKKDTEIFSSYIAENIKASAEPQSGGFHSTINGIDYLTYYRTIPNTDNWMLIYNVPLECIKAPIEDISISLAALGIIGVIIGGILSLIISKSISKPIVQLKNTFSKAAAGDLDIRSEISSKDEIGEASKGFNTMMNTISHLIYNDALTDLPNRLMFYNRLELEISKAFKQGKKLSIMLIDIDKFEKINNTVGYTIGDKLLQQVANKIKEFVAQNADVYRISDDKFAILFTDSILERNVIKAAQGLTDLIKAPWDVDNSRFYITASTGVVFYPNDGDNSRALLKNVYAAMIKAKKLGRDNFQLYDASIGDRAHDMLILDNTIHKALENNEFDLYYQPQVDILSGKIIGAEALLRWRHSELGMVSPDRFIPIIEDNGLIVPIGEWVLRTACFQNKAWQDSGLKPIKISVNISAVQLRQDNFVELVSDVLKETGLKPEYLELEITESAAMENTKSMASILERLRNMAISIAIDDFGTGYSSLNYLKSFEITTLKIDQSFIRDLSIDSKGEAIVSTILAIGHNLNLSVTAEGVETCEQLNFLRERQCDVIQGYLYSKPVPKAGFEALLSNEIKNRAANYC